MGKAKRQLNAVRKEIFKEIERKYSPSEHESNSSLESNNEEKDTKIIDLAYYIRQALFDYIDETAYPLCEYLDINNMINYVKWVVIPNL